MRNLTRDKKCNHCFLFAFVFAYEQNCSGGGGGGDYPTFG